MGNDLAVRHCASHLERDNRRHETVGTGPNNRQKRRCQSCLQRQVLALHSHPHRSPTAILCTWRRLMPNSAAISRSKNCLVAYIRRSFTNCARVSLQVADRSPRLVVPWRTLSASFCTLVPYERFVARLLDCLPFLCLISCPGGHGPRKVSAIA